METLPLAAMGVATRALGLAAGGAGAPRAAVIVAGAPRGAVAAAAGAGIAGAPLAVPVSLRAAAPAEWETDMGADAASR